MRTLISPLSRFILAAGVFCAAAVLCAQPGRDDDPLPIARIAIPPERVAKELERVQQGTLTLQPLDEFEARVANAQKLLVERKQKPRLRGATYRAELAGQYLVNGSGQWHIHNSSTAPALLPIDPISMALHRIKWERGSDGALAEFNGNSLGLLVPGMEFRTCFFDWSMRGNSTQDGIQFPIAIPPCASCEFELLVPSDYWGSIPKSPALVTGPIESESAGKRLWRIQASGLSQFTITFRRVADTGANGSAAPTIFTKVASTQSIEPRRVSLEHDFHVDIVHGSVQELVFEGDPRLQPYEVSFRGGQLKNWQWKEGAIATKSVKGKTLKTGKESPGILKLQFDQPMHGKLDLIRVRSITAAPTGESWTSPALRLPGAFPSGESLSVRLHPLLPIAKWNSGSFEMTNSSSDLDGTQSFTLVESTAGAGASQRPTVLFHANSVDIATDSRCRWDISDSSAVYQAELRCAASRGSLYELRVVLPKTNPGYVLDQVSVQPQGMMRGWYISGDSLVVELKQPLTPTRDAMVTLRMRSTFAANTGAGRILFHPDVNLINATRRTGRLDVYVASSARAQLVSSSLPQTSTKEGDARDPMPGYSFNWRNQRLTAAIRVTPRPGQIAVRGEHRIALQGTTAAVRFRWEIEPSSGSPHFIDFRLSPGFPVDWRIAADEGKSPIHHVEKLPAAESLPYLLALGTPSPLGCLSTQAAAPPGQVWRFHFSEPIRARTAFAVETAIEPEAPPNSRLGMPKPSRNERVWVMPAMTPIHAASIVQEIAIEGGDETIERVDGASDNSDDRRATRTPTGMRIHEFANDIRPFQSLRKIWTRRTSDVRSSTEYCDEAGCLTKIYRDGRIYHQLHFRLSGHRAPTCELRLPEAMHVVAVKVQDRWLNHFRAQANDAEVVLSLPCDDSAAATRYVIVAKSPKPDFLVPGFRRTLLPRIGWPVPPIDVQMRLAVEDGVTPLFHNEREPLGTPRGLSPKSDWLRRAHAVWTWGNAWLLRGKGESPEVRIEDIRRTALLAEARLHAESAGTSTLAALLERFALVELKEKLPLVIDRQAFKELGLDAQSAVDPKLLRMPVDRPFWEALGLVAIASPHGLLLTTSSRMRQLGVTSVSQVDALGPAMREALRTGRDSSGGFALVTAWLNHAATPSDQGPDAKVWHGPDDAKLLMHEWDVPITANGGVITLLDKTTAQSLGWLLALGWLILSYASRNRMSARVRVRVHLSFLVGIVLAMSFSPAEVAETIFLPGTLSLGVGMIAALTASSRAPHKPAEDEKTPRPTAVAGTVAGMVLLGMFAWQGFAQPMPVPMRSHTVWIISSPKPAVLVPAELSTLLADIEKPANFASQPAVLLSARYTGRIVENRARFDVEYEVLCVRPTNNFVLPLTGVQLEDGSLVNGAPSYPSPNKNGYSLAIRKPGMHHIRLSFTAPIESTSGGQAVRFACPKSPRCELRMDWPAPVQSPQMVRGWGQETVLTGLPSSARRWQAQIGYENEVHFRWTTGPAAPLAKSISVAEAHYWDLRPGNIALTSQLHYRLDGVTLGQIAVSVPVGMHIQSIEANTVSLAGALRLPIAIKRWEIQGKAAQRRLIVEFAKPTSGELTLRLDALPTELTNRRLVLKLPAPIQGKSTEGWLGYRLDATESRGAAQNLAVQSMTTAEFLQNWQRLGGIRTAAPTRAYRFQRKAVVAGLELFVLPSELKARCEFIWNIDSAGADLSASCVLNDPVGDIKIAEFQVPAGIVVAGVSGVDVNRWQLHENHLQVWLKQPKKQTTITIAGWRVHASKNINQIHSALVIQPLHAQLVDSVIELRPDVGLEVDVVNQRALRRTARKPVRFAVTASPWDLTYKLLRPKVSPEVDTVTRVQRDEYGIAWSQELRVRSDRGKLPSLHVKITGEDADRVMVNAPDGVESVLPTKKTDESHWQIKFTSGLPAEVLVTLSARLNGDGTASKSLPSVEILGADVARPSVTWKDVDLIDPKTRKIITHNANGSNVPAGWKTAPLESTPEVAARKPAPAVAIRVIALAETISQASLGDWVHEASCWIRGERATELRLDFPQPVDILHLAIDGQTLSTAVPDENSRTLTLKPGFEPRHLVMRWRYQPGSENPNEPITEPVRISNGRPGISGSVLILSRGLSVRDRGTDAEDRVLLHSLLQEAEIEVRLLDPAPPAGTALNSDVLQRVGAGQLRFHRLLRQASYLNSIAPFAGPDFDSSEIQGRIENLKKRNAELTKKHGWEKLRLHNERTAAVTPCAIPRAEWPMHGSVLLVDAGKSTLPLLPRGDTGDAGVWSVSELAILVAVVLFILSFVRQTYTLVRLAAPEIAALTVLAAAASLGVGLLPIVLMASFVAIRFFNTFMRLRARFFPPPAPRKSADQASTRTLPPTVN